MTAHRSQHTAGDGWFHRSIRGFFNSLPIRTSRNASRRRLPNSLVPSWQLTLIRVAAQSLGDGSIRYLCCAKNISMLFSESRNTLRAFRSTLKNTNDTQPKTTSSNVSGNAIRHTYALPCRCTTQSNHDK